MTGTFFSNCLTTCNPQAADIVFAIDQSANIPSQDLYKIGDFIDQYIQLINNSQGISGISGLGLVRVGLILFSSDVKVFTSQFVQYLYEEAIREYREVSNPKYGGVFANFLKQAWASEQNVTDFNR